MQTRSTVRTPYLLPCSATYVSGQMFRFRHLQTVLIWPVALPFGNISNTQVALNTVDIGLPQLAMHSPYETAGVKDTEYLVRAAKEFFC